LNVTWRDDRFHDECGLFGIWNHPEAANVAYLGLYALQHRGQESAGIAATDGSAFHTEKHMGWVADVFSPERLRRLPGHRAIGHVRYSTAGSSNLRNAQPITATTARGPIAIAHNGNLTNADTLRREMERDGAIFQSNSDTEVILHLLARAPAGPLEEQIAHALGQVQGAYSLLIMTLDALYAIRDPYGFRPLTLGRLGDAHVVASETCALDLMEAKCERDVEPGEILIISDAGTRSVRPFAPAERLHCVFEYVYFARPDSILWGRNVHTVRKAMGRQLAREYPVGADIVIPVPDSGTSAALGYSEESGISYEMGLIRNHYVGRTFIEPKQGIRHFGVKVKLNPMREMLEGRRVVVVDDSIVRGTTTKQIVALLRRAGAEEVHVRISAPPIYHPCFYGIDTQVETELIAASKSVEEIREFLGADSLGYLSIAGVLTALDLPYDRFCFACFDGRYPEPVPYDSERRKFMLEEPVPARG
jgi:amidophosphoribosyltransferase